MSTWEEKWIEDIDYLKDSLIRKHANLFANITKEEFNHNIDTLKNIANELDYEEMKVEISKIVASVNLYIWNLICQYMQKMLWKIIGIDIWNIAMSSI